MLLSGAIDRTPTGGGGAAVEGIISCKSDPERSRVLLILSALLDAPTPCSARPWRAGLLPPLLHFPRLLLGPTGSWLLLLLPLIGDMVTPATELVTDGVAPDVITADPLLERLRGFP